MKMQTVTVLGTLILVLHSTLATRCSPTPEVLRGQPTRDTCVHIPTGGLRCVSWNTRELLGSTASFQISRELKQKYLTRLARNNDIICLEETHRKDEILQAQVLHTQFPLFGTFTLNKVTAGVTTTSCQTVRLVTRVTTCQGRDHIVT